MVQEKGEHVGKGLGTGIGIPQWDFKKENWIF